MKTSAILALILFFASSLYSQTRVVHGNLTAFNEFPVKNVEVSSKKAKATTMTDSLGQFSLVCLEDDVIKIKPKAFNKVSKRVGPETESVSVNLRFIDSKANRQIAIGYGYISSEHLTYAVNHLEQENNEFCSYTDIFDLIRGQFSGVTVSGDDIVIRGGNSSFSSGGSTALYVVDNHTTSSIAWIQPCQIKSIDVLKDGEAAIYGSSGGNGVVVIEMKK